MKLAKVNKLCAYAITLVWLSACGYKGPLVLPEQSASNQASGEAQPDVENTPAQAQQKTPKEGK